MALYQKYETKILTENGIDIRDDGTKRDIELYDLDQMLQLPAEPLERIRNFVDDYSSLTGQTFKLSLLSGIGTAFHGMLFCRSAAIGQT